MDVVGRVIKNTISLSLIRIVNPLVSFLLVVIIARYRAVTFLGNYSLILAIVGIFEIVSCLGLETLIIRDLSKKTSEAGKYIVNCLTIMFCSGLFFASLLCLTANVLGYEKDVKIALYIGSLLLIPSGFSVVGSGVFKAFEKNIYLTIVAVIENMLRVGLSLVALFMGFGVSGLMVVSLGSTSVGILLMFYFINSMITTKVAFELDLEFCKTILRATFTFAMIGIVVSLYWRVGVIMLSKFEGAAAVGIFSAAFRLYFIVVSLIVAFGVSVFPTISKKYEDQPNEFGKVCVDAARYVVILVIFIAVVGTFVSEDIIRLLYGGRFKDSVCVLQILIWGAVPYSMVTVFAYSLFSSYNQKVDLAINLVGLLSNVFLNILLVPRFSYIGTSYALVGSTCILLMCQYIFIRRRLFAFNLARIVGMPLLSSTMMITLILVFRSKVNLYLLIVVSGFVYFLVLYFFNGFKEYEKVYLRNLCTSALRTWRPSLLRK